jgi:ParB family chromosome partitioning protein
MSKRKKTKKVRGLGQGLGAIFKDQESRAAISSHVIDYNTLDGYHLIDIEKLSPSPFQPRTIFNEEELSELSSSIKKNGVLQPLIVRKTPEDLYEIIAGERRWRAGKQAGLKTIPVIVKPLTDEEAMIIALIENIQRENLSPLEEAEGLQKLSQTDSQEDIARLIGKSRSYVTNVLRLNKLPEEVKDLLRDNKINAGVARSLVGHPNAMELARLAMDNKLSVRDVETLAQKMKPAQEAGQKERKSVTHEPRSSAKAVLQASDEEKMAAERAIENTLGLKTKLTLGSKKNILSIYFDSMEQLDGLLEKLT